MIRRQPAPLFALLVCLAATPVFAQQFVFDMTGEQEVPPVPSTATGGCAGVLDQGAATFAITCVHDVENATIMHIHRAPAGANGPIAFDMGDPSSGTVNATWTGMTPADIADLLAGNLYMNVHTAGRPAGEIRGQILTRTVDEVAFTASAAQVVPPGTSPGTGNCTADLSDDASTLAVQCTHTLPAPNAAHVHQAPAGSTGPAIFTFPSPVSPIAGNVPMTQQLLAAFAARHLYVDIHAGTTEEDADEIRGQIGTPPAGATGGTVIIAKRTYPAGGLEFGFTDTIAATPFTLNDGETHTFSGVAPGAYSVTEGPGGDYTLGDISCDDANSSGNVATRSAAINVEAGETVRCTFTNFETMPTDELFVFHMSPDQEVPALTGPERGGCMARFDAGASQLSIVCTHNVDLPTMIHIHRAPAGANGPVAFDMGLPDSPVFATWTMTPADVADLMAGNLYVNVHTAGRPAGATRGQILPRTVDVVNFALNAAEVVPPGGSTATGNCTADLDATATQLAVSCTHNLATPTAAHVHQGERGENGPVVHTFSSPASPINENVPVTPRLVADFAGELLYLDVHRSGGDEETAEEIRGQIANPAVAITTGTIRIVKSTTPAGGTNFNFTTDITGGPAAFTLNDGGQQEFLNVPAGTYTVTEVGAGTWSPTDVVCTDNDSNGNAFSGTATVNLQANELVTCTFRNLRNTTAPTQFVFHMSGDQEVPPVASTARGGCYGQLDEVARSFTLVCTHNVDSPAVAHIHRAPAGANGDVVFDLGDPASPIEASWTNMTPAQVADLLAGNYYVNIHASGRPAGEIRGQVLPRTVDTFLFPVTPDQEVPPTDSTASGNCSANLADDASSVAIQCTHDVDNVIDTHLHAAPPGVDGPAIFHFANANQFAGSVPLSSRLVADFAAGFLYVNVHSVDYETGEIRGNLIGAPAHEGVEHVPTASEWALILMGMGLALLAVARLRIT